MINGNPVYDRIQLNIESLWSGGPFQDPVGILPFTLIYTSYAILFRRTMVETTKPRRLDISLLNWQGLGKLFLHRLTELFQVSETSTDVRDNINLFLNKCL